MHKMLAYWEVQNCQSLNSWHLLTLLKKKKKRITSHFSLIYLKCVHVNGGPSIDLYSFQLVIGPHGSWNQEGWFEMQMSRQWSTPPLLFPLLYLSGWKVACTRVSHPYSLNYFSWTHRAVTSCGGCGSCSSFSALYPGARNCFEKDCCFSPQWHCEAFSRVSTDSGGCRSDCSLSPDDPEPWR